MLSLSNQDHLGLFGILVSIRKSLSVHVTALSQGSQQGEGLHLEVLATQPGSRLFMSDDLYLLHAPVPAFPFLSSRISPEPFSGQRAEQDFPFRIAGRTPVMMWSV